MGRFTFLYSFLGVFLKCSMPGGCPCLRQGFGRQARTMKMVTGLTEVALRACPTATMLCILVFIGNKWWRRRDLNPGHHGYEPCALTD